MGTQKDKGSSSGSEQGKALWDALFHLPGALEKQGYRIGSVKVAYRWTDALVILSAHNGAEWVVAFTTGPNMEKALLTALKDALGGETRWKPDKWKNESMS